MGIHGNVLRLTWTETIGAHAKWKSDCIRTVSWCGRSTFTFSLISRKNSSCPNGHTLSLSLLPRTPCLMGCVVESDICLVRWWASFQVLDDQSQSLLRSVLKYISYFYLFIFLYWGEHGCLQRFIFATCRQKPEAQLVVNCLPTTGVGAES